MNTKICLIVSSMQNAGGMERVMSELATYFSLKSKVEVHLIILTKMNKFYHIPDNVIIHEPEFDYRKYKRLFFTIKIAYYLRKTVNKIAPDTILSFGEKYNLFVLLSLIFSGKKIYISDRCSPIANINSIYKLVRAILYRTAAGIICQTQYSKNILYSQTKNKNIKVIPNPIKFFESRGNIKRENIILNIGRLVDLKQQEKLIRFLAEIDNKDWKLVFLGDGPLKTRYLNYARQLGVESNVEFIGSMNNIGSYLAKSKIFAFTSLSEGFPNALAEAMFFPVASISFDCIAGPGDLINDGINGYLVELKDEETYISKLKRLMEDENLRESFENKAMESKHKYAIESIGGMYFDEIAI